MLSDQCYLYFISANDGHQMVKIGISADPKKRLAGLKTASPYALDIAWTITYGNRSTAEFAERILHYAFQEYRMCGEWFRIPADVAIEAQSAIAEILEDAEIDPEDFYPLAHQTVYQLMSYRQ